MQAAVLPHIRNTAIFRTVAIRCPSTTGCMRVGDCAQSSSRSTMLPRVARKLSDQVRRITPSLHLVTQQWLPLLRWLQLSTAWVCHERMTCLTPPKQPRSNSLPLKYASHTSHRSYPHFRLQASDPISYSTYTITGYCGPFFTDAPSQSEGTPFPITPRLMWSYLASLLCNFYSKDALRTFIPDRSFASFEQHHRTNLGLIKSTRQGGRELSTCRFMLDRRC
jgi:hypothetical protein